MALFSSQRKLNQMAKNDEAPESLDDKIARALATALEKALPAMAAAAVQTQISAQDAKSAAQYLARPSGEKCAECQQRLPAGVPQGSHKHIKVAIFPSHRKHGKWFQGLFVNGVKYLSNHAGHLLTVPADLDLSLIRNWEDNEDVMKDGREVDHNSGTLGGQVHHADHTTAFR